MTEPSSILVVLSGLPATGKSSVANRLLRGRPGLHLSTDETRERMFSRAEVGSETKYSDHASKVSYAENERRARKALLGGGSLVVLDGTYLRAKDRRRAIRIGLHVEADVLVLELEAARATIEARLAARVSGADHHSEADLSVYQALASKLCDPESEYSPLCAEEFGEWVGRPVVAVRLATDSGVQTQIYGTPNASIQALLNGLSSDFAG